jgi:hypothetical protein
MPVAYRWKPGARVAVDAEVVGQIFERLTEEGAGELTPEAILKEAQPKASPLHGHFEWNDGKAARAYRQEQAKYLVRSLEVQVLEPTNEPQEPMRAFVSVATENEARTYMPIQSALSDEGLRLQVLGTALRELKAWRKRYEELSDLAKVFAAIDEVTK